MNLQLQSPLFSTLPPEIRNRIFWLALQEYDNPAKPYPRETRYTRPGCLGEKRVDTELLRTCKIVYAETKAIPLQETEVQVHLDSSNSVPLPGTYLEVPLYLGMPRVGSTDLDENYLAHSYVATKYKKLSPEQWTRIKDFRFFAPLRTFNPMSVCEFFLNHARATPETITLCVRYTDWRCWEDNGPLSLSCSKWRWDEILFPASVKRVVLELETAHVGSREKQLNTIVADFLARPDECMYDMEDGKMLRISEKKGVKAWTWQGPTTFGHRTRYAHHPEGDTMRYVVKVLTWEVVEGSGVGDEVARLGSCGKVYLRL